MGKRTPQKNGSETRWLYQLENTALTQNRFAKRDRSMAYLRDLAARVWNDHAPAGRRIPTIVAGKGHWEQDQFWSYTTGYTRIELTRKDRNILVLLHELTHCLGPCLHGKKFIAVYFPLLKQYGGYDSNFLQGIAAAKNIELKI